MRVLKIGKFYFLSLLNQQRVLQSFISMSISLFCTSYIMFILLYWCSAEPEKEKKDKADVDIIILSDSDDDNVESDNGSSIQPVSRPNKRPISAISSDSSSADLNSATSSNLNRPTSRQSVPAVDTNRLSSSTTSSQPGNSSANLAPPPQQSFNPFGKRELLYSAVCKVLMPQWIVNNAACW